MNGFVTKPGLRLRPLSTQFATMPKLIVGEGSKTYQQLGFSLPETRQFLGPKLTDLEVSDINRLCHGIPGRLAAVKRLLQSGLTLEDILNTGVENAPRFIQLEFRSLQALDITSKLALALLTFGRQAATPMKLSSMLGVSAEEVRSALSICTFLKCASVDDGISFVSEAHRRFAETTLGEFRRNAIQLQIEYLRRNPTGGDASRFIPSYLEQLGDGEALIAQLSPDHFKTLLSETSSTIAMKAQADLGLAQALELRKFSEVLRFVFQKSIFSALAQSDELPSEVGALVALGQPENALKIASLAVSNEARLSLLATYARQAKAKSGIVDPAILEFIRELVSRIDLSQLGDKAAQLATDLMFFDADLAIAIIENATVQGASSRIEWKAAAGAAPVSSQIHSLL